MLSGHHIPVIVRPGLHGVKIQGGKLLIKIDVLLTVLSIDWGSREENGVPYSGLLCRKLTVYLWVISLIASSCYFL